MFKSLSTIALIFFSTVSFAQQELGGVSNATVSSCKFSELNLTAEVTSTPASPIAADGSLFVLTAQLFTADSVAIPSLGGSCKKMPRGGYHCSFAVNPSTRVELNFSLVDHVMSKAGLVVWNGDVPKSEFNQNCTLN